MCGIAGYIDFNKNTEEEVLAQMTVSLNHRGPDDKGAEVFYEDHAQIGFGQARLSIIDLSSGGHQPMHYRHFSIVFNGEIYNYLEVRNELIKLGHEFNSKSDTEVILHAYEAWGKEAVHRFIGMFAIVIYDRNSKEIICIRDRAGVKPFYYYIKNGLFLFASELKAFHKHPLFQKEIDLAAVSLFFDFGYIPAPYSIFKDCFKLEPGHFLVLKLETGAMSCHCYWDVNDFYKKPKLSLSYYEAKEQLKSILISACNYRMIADVNVGVFLSGGYDSTLVTSLIQHSQSQPIKTFTIGFYEGNNEAPAAKRIATTLGTDHTEYYCTTKEAQDIIPLLPFFYDEPFADSSAIPTILVSRIAREMEVIVALSADGGDEIFCGYEQYRSLADKMYAINRIPGRLKEPARYAVTMFEKMILFEQTELKHKLYGLKNSLNKDALKQAASLFRSMNILPQSYRVNLFSKEPPIYGTPYNVVSQGFQDPIELAMAVDYKSYLQNDILTKIDRATMSVSLEGREPLLDNRIIEFVARLPLSYKYDGRTTKKIIRDIVHEYVPFEVMNRPKSGFSLPIFTWLLKDLTYLMDEYLNSNAIEKSEIFNTDFTLSIIKLFKENKLHYKTFIWKLLMFQMWYKKWMN